MPRDTPYVALDWGTTNRRAFLVNPDGTVAQTQRDDRGILATSPEDYAADIAALRAQFGVRDIYAAGMIGSNRGWHEVPYIELPASLERLAAAAHEVAPYVWIIPGVALRHAGRADVMRGEEVQVLGAIAMDDALSDGLFCQPGTHNKWVVARGGAIVDFSTAMTGELFSHLRAHGVLAGMLDGDVADGPAFREGLERGRGARDLTVALFEVRARVLLGTLPPEDAASYASGILIGADIGSRPEVAHGHVGLLANGALSDLYAAGIRHAGGSPSPLDSHAAFVAGIHAIRRHVS